MPVFYALHDYDDSKKLSGTILIKSNKHASQLNSDGYGIFFAVNEFNGAVRREAELKKLRFWFVDMDKGSKDSQAETILNFPLLPTMVVETKSGHHVYWGMRDDEINQLGLSAACERYVHTLDGLVSFFNGDNNAKGTTRILRVPNYFHCKDPRHNFLIQTNFESDNKYTHDEMLEVLVSLNVYSKKPEPKPARTNRVYNDTDNSFWEDASNIDCEYGLRVLSGARELNSDIFSFYQTRDKVQIYANGNKTSCWIDSNKKIGSFGKGGPSLIQWVEWYGYNKAETAKILETYFPELKKEIVLNGFC